MLSGFDKEIGNTPSASDGKVKVDGADAGGFLRDKLVQGNNVTLAVGQSNITISGQPGRLIITRAVTSVVNAQSGYHYICDGVVQINLPPGAEGASIGISDIGNTFMLSPVTIIPNGSDYVGKPYQSSLVLDRNMSCIVLGFTNGVWAYLSAESFNDLGSTGGEEIVSPGTATGLVLEHTSTPSDPGTGKTVIYAKTDGYVYKLATGGSESPLGDGPGGSGGVGLSMGDWDASGTFSTGVRLDAVDDKILFPTTTTAARSGVALLESELVYDSDEGLFYYGDGVTVGGIPLATGSGVGITLDTTNFNGTLSGADTTVQLALETLDDITLGTAAALDVGTGANQIVQLDAGVKLPAVDGSQLTNLPSDEIKLTGNQTWYISTTGTTAADGLTVGTPITLAEAVSRINRINAASNYLITLQFASGTYSNPEGYRILLSDKSESKFRIKFAGTSWVGVIDAPDAKIQAPLTIKEIYSSFEFVEVSYISNTNGGIELRDVALNSLSLYGKNCSSYIWGLIQTSNSSDSPSMFYAYDGAYLELDANFKAYTGNFNFTKAFITVGTNATIGLDSSPTLTGTFTGKRILYEDPSVLFDYGQEFIDNLPGDVTDPYPNWLIDVNNKVATFASPPATASSTGTAGQIAYDASYIYICTATDTWLRAPIATW